MWPKLQHAGVVFLRTFLATAVALHFAISKNFATDVGAAAWGSGLAALTDLVAHWPHA